MGSLHADVALEFARLLTSGAWTEAHGMLEPSLARQVTAVDLRDSYEEMTSFGEAPWVAEQDPEFLLEDWHGRQPDDIGWAYVSLFGTGNVEAVRVIVSDTGSGPRIREIEWRRP